jgi:cold shock CspA family protein/ribosome-associated translation inhibitor RaiA
MPPSDAVERGIREKAVKLESFCGKIMGCRVLVEAPHRHHRKGKLYHVRIDLTLPGGEIVINHEPSQRAAHKDVYVAIRDAFAAARRKLQDFSRRRRGVLKVHEPPPSARVAKLFSDKQFGFLETPDGREIYFHGHSVLNGGFGALKVGAEVHFVEEPGEKGPQASTVAPIKHPGTRATSSRNRSGNKSERKVSR